MAVIACMLAGGCTGGPGPDDKRGGTASPDEDTAAGEEGSEGAGAEGAGDPADADPDADADGASDDDDCAPDDPDTYPGADEVCGDGVINDCDSGAASEREAGCTTWALTTASAIIRGAEPYQLAGWSVAGRGDTDGDGRADILVGAPGYASDGSSRGHVGLFTAVPSGELRTDEGAAWIIGADRRSSAGASVAWAGDPEGAGTDGVLVGSPGTWSSAGEVGYLAGPVIGDVELSAADATFSGTSRTPIVGSQVAGDSDTDGDGVVDVLVAAATTTETDEVFGEVYVVLGPLSGALDADDAAATLSGPYDTEGVGMGMDLAGDLNADGIGDVAVGAPYQDREEHEAGTAAVFCGPVSGELVIDDADLNLRGGEYRAWLGFSVRGVGDVTGDGQDDLATGAVSATGEVLGSGVVYVVAGGLAGDTVVSDAASAQLLGEEADAWAGSSIGGPLDADGDATGDLLTSDINVGRSGDEPGTAYLFLGPVTGTLALSEAWLTLTGEADEDRAGYAVDGAGDTDGDGLDEIVVGAPFASGTGAAYVLSPSAF